MASADLIRELTGGLRHLSDQDRTFAQSLIASVERRGMASEKQLYWLERMLAKSKGEPATKTEAVGDLAAVYAMFDTAKAHLKKPAIVLGYQRGSAACELKLYVAGPSARVPGSLNVLDVGTRTWFGRVHQDGTFEQSRRDPPPYNVTDVLKRFSADPIKVAGEHGHLTGKCCFCNRTLSDERSTAVGYGPVCASHFGLEWGAKASASLPLAAPVAAPDDEVRDDWAAEDAGDAEDAAERQAMAAIEGYAYQTGGY